MFRLLSRCCTALLALFLAPTVKAEASIGLTLDEAVRLALSSDDPYLAMPETVASALEDKATAESQLPDPKVRIAFANWPTNSFSYSQEAMTQFQLGVSQAFPRGNSRALAKEKRKVEAIGMRHLESLRRREVILETRTAWLELDYLFHARLKVKDAKAAVGELVGVIQANFAVGKNKSQDIFRAQMELGLLDDRLLEIDRRIELVRPKLARRIGEAALRNPIGGAGMKHPSDENLLLELLTQHPAVNVQASKTAAASKDVAMAGEQYKPGWGVNLGYGARGADRADFASVGITMDVPLFTKKRQDKRLSAAKKMRQSERLNQDGLVLDLRQKLQAVYSDWQRTIDRIQLYEGVVRQRAKETADASLSSYQNGVTDFPELIRARLAELETELKLLALKNDKLKAQAAILFFEGEDDA